MLQKTKGIVVSFIKYRDTSVIVKIFTREMGLRSYIVNGVRSSDKSNKMALYQPLTLLEMVVYENPSKNLQRISEAKLYNPSSRIPFDFYRSGIALFVSEVLAKSIVEGYQNQPFFDFLERAIGRLDSEHVILSHYPIAFLLESSKHLGFAPLDANSFFEELDLPRVLSDGLGAERDYLDALVADSFGFRGNVASLTRRNLLDHYLGYFVRHLDLATDWKSVEVLRHLMHQ